LKIKAKIVLLFKYFAHRSYKYTFGRLKELYDGPVDIEPTG
jgi:hypothetical protein